MLLMENISHLPFLFLKSPCERLSWSSESSVYQKGLLRSHVAFIMIPPSSFSFQFSACVFQTEMLDTSGRSHDVLSL